MSKTGKWAQSERDFVRKNLSNISPDIIAIQLNRPLKAVLREIAKMGESVSTLQCEREIEITPEWNQLKREMSQDELSFFRHRLAKLFAQFSQDLLPTEETQLHQLIRFEILMNRVMIEINSVKVKIENLESDYKLYVESADENDKEAKLHIENLERQINAMRNANIYKTNELIKFQEKYDDILKALKGTRDQRIKQIEDRTKNWIDIIKAFNQKQFRDKQGYELEMFKKGVEKEKQRLGEYHTFMNKEVEKPLLNEHTVGDA